MAQQEVTGRTVHIEWEPVNDGGRHKSSNEIERDIEGTRHEMDRTMDELNDRLSPRHFIDQFLDIFHSDRSGIQGLSDTGNRIIEVFRDNPFPTMLIGAGVGWILWDRNQMSRQRPAMGDGKSRATEMIREQSEGARGTAQEQSRQFQTEAKRRAESLSESSEHVRNAMRDKTDQAKNIAQERIGEFRDSTMEKARDLQNRASEFQGKVKDRSREFGESFRDRYSQNRDRAIGAIRDNPLGVGMAALAFGIFAGLLIPSARSERESIGERGRELKERAQEKMQGMTDKAYDVKNEAQNIAQEKASEYGVQKSDVAGTPQPIPSGKPETPDIPSL